jgi:NAD(P)-dependent dehydrogenase (short-subunit alcohol dehydrogenase family)
MDLQLVGKRTLVTGSTAGIGFAAAAGLYREGASVVLNGRSAERVEQAVKKIKEVGGDGEVSGIAADLSTAEGVADSVVPRSARQLATSQVHILHPFRYR